VFEHWTGLFEWASQNNDYHCPWVQHWLISFSLIPFKGRGATLEWTALYLRIKHYSVSQIVINLLEPTFLAIHLFLFPRAICNRISAFDYHRLTGAQSFRNVKCPNEATGFFVPAKALIVEKFTYAIRIVFAWGITWKRN
jgi:hypothetical protein